jgi:hypothetical protein
MDSALFEMIRLILKKLERSNARLGQVVGKEK